MKSKRQSINKFLGDNPGLCDFRKLDNRTFDDWCAKMVEAGKAGKTVNNYADHVTGCLRFMRDKRSQRMTINLEAIDRAAEDGRDMPYYTPTEVGRIKEHCNSLREELLISLIFDSAMRIHEVAKIELSHIDENHVRVYGKGRKLRDTFILPATRALLDRWLILAGISDGYLFPSPTNYGCHLSAQQVRGAINAPIHRAGLAGSAQAIRRSSITAALDGGMALQDAARWAGHADPKTTLKHYYKVAAQQLQIRHAKAFASTSLAMDEVHKRH